MHVIWACMHEHARLCHCVLSYEHACMNTLHYLCHCVLFYPEIPTFAKSHFLCNFFVLCDLKMPFYSMPVCLWGVYCLQHKSALYISVKQTMFWTAFWFKWCATEEANCQSSFHYHLKASFNLEPVLIWLEIFSVSATWKLFHLSLVWSVMPERKAKFECNLFERACYTFPAEFCQNLLDIRACSIPPSAVHHAQCIPRMIMELQS